MEDNGSNTAEQASRPARGQGDPSQGSMAITGLPCRGCTKDCGLRSTCQGKPWRLSQ